MPLFINGIGAISPQVSFANVLSHRPTIHQGNKLTCVEPDYTAVIEPKLLRRMSRIVKFGVASANSSIHDAHLSAIDGVIVGTGWGCIEDTVTFLSKMVENQEEALSPTAFIHSTHNTIAAQIAYQLKCKGYNSTYSHRSISFESALIDALLLLQDSPEQSLLVGGVDELTSTSFNILSRFNTFKVPASTGSDTLFTSKSEGTIAGEGSTFFTLSGVQQPSSYCEILGVRTISFAPLEDAIKAAHHLLKNHSLAKIDLLILGQNGDAENDKSYSIFAESIAHNSIMTFKELCGEYPTATAFALGLSATILKQANEQEDSPKNIIIYNRSQQNHQTVMLLSAC